MTEHQRFAANCPTCGDLDVVAEQMWLVLTDSPGRDHYFFHCPGCGEHVRRHAHVITVRLLERYVPVERIRIPAEALESHVGEPLTSDDLIDLMLAIEATDGRPATGAGSDGGSLPTELPARASYRCHADAGRPR